MLPHHPVKIFTEWLLPTTEDATLNLWERNDQLHHAYDDPPHPDELNERYVHTRAETDVWQVFEIPLYGFEADLYFWNAQGGVGFCISTLEDDVDAITDAFGALAEADQ